MAAVRRLYVYLVCAITLLALCWSVITLLWAINPFGPRATVTAVAFNLASILVALPLFLAHWLWAQRLAVAEEEQGDVFRRIYLYGTLGVFLFALSSQLLNLITMVAVLLPRFASGQFAGLGRSQIQPITDANAAIIVLGLLFLYQRWTISRDTRSVPETDAAAAVHRLYTFFFSTVGLVMTVFSLIQLLRWTLVQIGGPLVIRDVTLADEIPRLLVGAVLWLVFWTGAENLLSQGSEREQESVLRKLYLYLVLFAASAGAVIGAAFTLDEIIRRMLGLAASGDIRNPISVMLTMLVMWAYHYIILRADTKQIPDLPRQAGVRRLYLYLVAGIGLAAFLGGLIGEGNVLVRSLAGESLGGGLKELLAWSTAAILTGLPVWLVPWRQLQSAAAAPGAAGMEERRSITRKIYLYLYLFFATITVLVSVIFILSQILSLVLGARPSVNLILDLSQAIGFAAIAVAVWIYHGITLRGDGGFAKREQAERLGTMKIAIVDAGDGQWGCAALNAFKREWPNLNVQPVGLTRAAAAAMGTSLDQAAMPAVLNSAGLIVGPWTIAAAAPDIAPEITHAITSSPAHKLLIPLWSQGWDWVGIERKSGEAWVGQAVRAVRQVMEGQEVRPARSAVVIAIAVAAAACIGIQLISVLVQFVAMGLD